MRRVEVIDHQDEWQTLFSKEVRLLSDIFGKELTAVHHIGSTSVPGMYAKPVIDMIPVVKNIDHTDAYNLTLTEAGYEPRGENGLPGRRFFMKGGDDRTHHLHIYEQGNPEIDRHLAFRDYLRSHPKAAETYSSLKKELAARFPYDMESYIDGKAAYVSNLEKEALVWFKRK